MSTKDVRDSEDESDDKWQCKECKKTFEEENAMVVECERCESHYCCKCIKMNKEDYKALNRRADIFWFCPPCAVKTKSQLGKSVAIEECTTSMLEKVSEKIVELENKIDNKLGEMQSSIPNTVSTYAKAVAKGTAAQNNIISDIVKSTMTKAQNNEKLRESRENNIIIYRAEESDKTEPSERKDDDIAFFDSLCCEALDVGKINVSSITRLGKKENNKTRPLKVCLENPNEKQRIFRSAKRLKNASERFQVSISADLSEEDRKAVRKMVDQAKEREKKKNEDGTWVFRVRGPPWNLHIVRLPVQVQTG